MISIQVKTLITGTQESLNSLTFIIKIIPNCVYLLIEVQIIT